MDFIIAGLYLGFFIGTGQYVAKALLDWLKGVTWKKNPQ